MNPDDHLRELNQLVLNVRDADAKRKKMPPGPERTRLYNQQRTWQRRIKKLRAMILRLRAGPTERTCLECGHCEVRIQLGMRCDAGHYDMVEDAEWSDTGLGPWPLINNQTTLTKQTLRTAIFRARSCKDFKREGFVEYWRKG